MSVTADTEKRLAGEAAAGEVESGMLVGLGTGSTAAFAIAAIARRVRDEDLRIRTVATSRASTELATSLGLPVEPFDGIAEVDLCIDGVDEIDGAFRAIKGGGGAMLREKIVATAATRNIAIADRSKRVDVLGADLPVPVEALPFARAALTRALDRIGAEVTLRRLPDGSDSMTDQGNLVLDCAFGSIADPGALAAALSALPGMLGHGLFLDEIDELWLGTPEGVLRTRRPAPPR